VEIVGLGGFGLGIREALLGLLQGTAKLLRHETLELGAAVPAFGGAGVGCLSAGFFHTALHFGAD
jgi:hypothetical protein